MVLIVEPACTETRRASLSSLRVITTEDKPSATKLLLHQGDLVYSLQSLHFLVGIWPESSVASQSALAYIVSLCRVHTFQLSACSPPWSASHASAVSESDKASRCPRWVSKVILGSFHSPS